MRIEPNIAHVAALIGEPSRAAILTVLMEGRAIPASDLARTAGVSTTAASGHLAKLVEGGLLAMEAEGRHRYYRLAGPDVATVIEDLAQLAGLPSSLELPRPSPHAKALRMARSCYDHLAGELAVAIAAALEKRKYLMRTGDKEYRVGGKHARRWFSNQGIDLQVVKPGRHGLAWQCLDWTERRPHVAGPLGTALFLAWRNAGWVTIDASRPRLVRVSALGRKQFALEFGISL